MSCECWKTMKERGTREHHPSCEWYCRGCAALSTEVKRMEGVIYAIRKHSDSLRDRMTEEGLANPIQSEIQGMITDKTVDFDNAIQIDVHRIARAVIAYLEGEG